MNDTDQMNEKDREFDGNDWLEAELQDTLDEDFELEMSEPANDYRLPPFRGSSGMLTKLVGQGMLTEALKNVASNILTTRHQDLVGTKFCLMGDLRHCSAPSDKELSNAIRKAIQSTTLSAS